MAASISKFHASLVKPTQETTFALANANFDFSLIKVQPREEYRPIGQALSRLRRDAGETGSQHTTARRLGSIFKSLIPRTPHLLKAYGQRASAISESPEVNPRGTREEHGAFSDYVGLDGSTIWAAATSGDEAISVHLLACMLASQFSHPQAVAIWSELIQERQRRLAESVHHEGVISIDDAVAAKLEVSNEQLAEWESSARAWFMAAGDAPAVKDRQARLLRAIRMVQLQLPVLGDSNVYDNVTGAWKLALNTMEGVVAGGAYSIQDGAVLVAMTSWHLYPDMILFHPDSGSNFASAKAGKPSQTELLQDDELIQKGGQVTVGLSLPGDQMSQGVTWALSLSNLHYYTPSSPVTGHLDANGRLSFDQFMIVVVGSIISCWREELHSMDTKSRGWEKTSLLLMKAVTDALDTIIGRHCSASVQRTVESASWIPPIRSALKILTADDATLNQEQMQLFNLGKRNPRLARHPNRRLSTSSQPLEPGWSSNAAQYVVSIAKPGDSVYDADPFGKSEAGPFFLVSEHIPAFSGFEPPPKYIPRPGHPKFELPSFSRCAWPAWSARPGPPPPGPPPRPVSRKIYTNFGVSSPRFVDIMLDRETQISYLRQKAKEQITIPPFFIIYTPSFSSECGPMICSATPIAQTPDSSPKHVRWTSGEWTAVDGGDEHLSLKPTDFVCAPGGYKSKSGNCDAVWVNPPRFLRHILRARGAKRRLFVEARENVSGYGLCNVAGSTTGIGLYTFFGTADAAICRTMSGVFRPTDTEIIATLAEGNIEPKRLIGMFHISRFTSMMGQISTLWSIFHKLPNATINPACIGSLDLSMAVEAHPRPWSTVLFPEQFPMPWATEHWDWEIDGLFCRRPSLPVTFAALHNLERGDIVMSSRTLQDVFAMSTGDSLFVAGRAVGDPGHSGNLSGVRHVRGHIGRSGISFLVAPRQPAVSKPDPTSWRVINHAPFDGKLENCFSGVSLHLRLIGDEVPILSPSNRFANAVRIGAVVSAHSNGKWISDLSFEWNCVFWNLKSYATCPRGVGHVVQRDDCSQSNQNIKLGTTRDVELISIENWEELLDIPRTPVVFKAHGNWEARLAAVCISQQLKYYPIVFGTHGCWDCAFRVMDEFRSSTNEWLLEQQRGESPAPQSQDSSDSSESSESSGVSSDEGSEKGGDSADAGHEASGAQIGGIVSISLDQPLAVGDSLEMEDGQATKEVLDVSKAETSLGSIGMELASAVEAIGPQTESAKEDESEDSTVDTLDALALSDETDSIHSGPPRGETQVPPRIIFII